MSSDRETLLLHRKSKALVHGDVLAPSDVRRGQRSSRDAVGSFALHAPCVIVTSGDPGGRLEQLPDRAVYVPKPWRALDIVNVAERAARTDHSVHALRL